MDIEHRVENIYSSPGRFTQEPAIPEEHSGPNQPEFTSTPPPDSTGSLIRAMEKFSRSPCIHHRIAIPSDTCEPIRVSHPPLWERKV